MRLHVMIL